MVGRNWCFYFILLFFIFSIFQREEIGAFILFIFYFLFFPFSKGWQIINKSGGEDIFVWNRLDVSKIRTKLKVRNFAQLLIQQTFPAHSLRCPGLWHSNRLPNQMPNIMQPRGPRVHILGSRFCLWEPSNTQPCDCLVSSPFFSTPLSSTVSHHTLLQRLVCWGIQLQS